MSRGLADLCTDSDVRSSYLAWRFAAGAILVCCFSGVALVSGFMFWTFGRAVPGTITRVDHVGKLWAVEFDYVNHRGVVCHAEERISDNSMKPPVGEQIMVEYVSLLATSARLYRAEKFSVAMLVVFFASLAATIGLFTYAIRSQGDSPLGRVPTVQRRRKK